ncbi:hypothetical protein B0T10DRAFT_464681 [Thelonectria olida]|uniref:Uncharacterized protein n=1 Tax=Thelonectria olida TaxID=1576542 RepID=A0A9P9AMH0_9HYPO|nr:hypothetical protein B0T10DRAFT_464681 [Thelonectria olida]
MELCITAEMPFEKPTSRPKPFSPVREATTPSPATPPPHRLHPLASSPSPASSPTCSHREHKQPPSFLEFDLLIYDPAGTSDSMLTHPWDLPPTPLRISLNTTKAQLASLLRAHLPVASPYPLGLATSGSDLQSLRSSVTNSPSSSSGANRVPKLVAITLYWTFRGDILPLGPDDRDWHYRNPITKTDLLCRSEAEWFLLREMMTASSGALKCYLAIQGDMGAAAPSTPTPTRKHNYGRWFSYVRKSRGAAADGE